MPAWPDCTETAASGIELNISLVTVVQAPLIDYCLHTHLNVLTKKK